MARGDVISAMTYNVGGDYDYLVPSSGDEWMITAFGSSHEDLEMKMLHEGGSTWYDMVFPASPIPATAGDDSITGLIMQSTVVTQPMKWFIKQTGGYIRFRHATQAHNTWWMGIKTKE